MFWQQQRRQNCYTVESMKDAIDLWLVGCKKTHLVDTLNYARVWGWSSGEQQKKIERRSSGEEDSHRHGGRGESGRRANFPSRNEGSKGLEPKTKAERTRGKERRANGRVWVWGGGQRRSFPNLDLSLLPKAPLIFFLSPDSFFHDARGEKDNTWTQAKRERSKHKKEWNFSEWRAQSLPEWG